MGVLNPPPIHPINILILKRIAKMVKKTKNLFIEFLHRKKKIDPPLDRNMIHITSISYKSVLL